MRRSGSVGPTKGWPAMRSKTFEIRDRLTLIPALGVQLDPACEADRHLLARAGFGVSPLDQASYLLLVKLADAKAAHDPFAWGDRTMTVAHEYIAAHYDALSSGAVVDVEYILGETAAPKKSEAGCG